VLLFSVFGLSADYVLMALAPNVGWLFVGRTISGITAASFSTANAYIADITPPEQRASRFGLMGAAFGIGFIIGPTVGGLLGQIDPRLPFWAAAGLAFVNGLYGLFILPESLPKDRRAPFKIANASPLGSLRLFREHRGLAPLGVVMFFYFMGFQVLPSTSVLYTSFRYGWTVAIMGLMMGGVGLANIVVQVGIVKPFVKRFKERGALYTGVLFAAVGMFIYGAAPIGAIYWLGLPFYAMVGLVQPGVLGMMTRRIGPSEQGRLQGANASIMAAAGLIGPLLFTQVLKAVVPFGPSAMVAGAPFYLASALFFASFLVAAATRHASTADDPKPAIA
jgi:DHA1 family tetracycline resistance protein-like MFS transporter